ncbi:helix-turn-helix transcriptional regulator [Brevundimonas sp.]|uniref:helix-turn-helix domain-containing protein n=1 Tax=Brevundimonas sp. TaxID=1871086 RepID=UPI0025796658|nr:helix-turn-helix transcriptional regulator [Brevundimonas sp.]
MSYLETWRRSKGWSQAELAVKLGLRSKGHVSRLESGNGVTTDLAIAIDRLSAGEVPVAQLRPDLHDVRVLHDAEGAPA